MSKLKNPTLSTQFLTSLQTGIPVLLSGMPGEAKTAYTTALAKASGRNLETIIASTRDPSDIGGLPHSSPDNTHFDYIAPGWAHRIITKAKNEKPIDSILFFDEISCAPPSCQAGLLRVINEKVVGEHELPSTLWIAAAMNPPEVAANGWELSAPMANRFVHLEWELDMEQWINGMLSGFKEPNIELLPKDWQLDIPRHRALIASFIKARPALFRAFPKNENERSGPWPSPRSWDFAAILAAAFNSLGYDESSAIASVVGVSPAREYVHYKKHLDLPDPESILKKPKEFKIPSETDKCYAILSSVVSAVLNNNTNDRHQAAWLFLESMLDADRADIAAYAASILTQKENLPKGYKIPSCIGKFMPFINEANITRRR